MGNFVEVLILLIIFNIFKTYYTTPIVNDDMEVEDTQVVGSSLHQVYAKAPDLLAAGDHSTNKNNKKNNRKNSDSFKNDKGYIRSHSTKGGGGYKHYDSFDKKDGDGSGYEKHISFGNKKHGGNNGEYGESSSYNTNDKASGTANKPKFTSYHYETKSGSPVKKYKGPVDDFDDGGEGESDDGDIEETKISSLEIPSSDIEINGPISNEKYQSISDLSGQYQYKKPDDKKSSTKTPVRRPRKIIQSSNKRKTKDPQTAATEGDYYYDGEEGDDYYGEAEGDYYSDGEGDEYY